MLQKKGLHWNVYYDMMALTKAEKAKIRNAQPKFSSAYGQ